MEMTDQNDHVILEIPNSDPTMSNYNNNLGVVKEWYRFYTGKEITNYTRQRHIQKVPLLLLEGEKGDRNRKYYEPAVVSLGPYHYKSQTRFAQAEEYKLITLAEYGLITGKPIALLHNKVFEVIHDARKCYIDGSTNDYTDEEFNRMMLRDACFVLFFIECVTCGDNKLLLNTEYLGAIGFSNFMSDIFLLENQIPFVVLEVLLKMRFPEDEGERILNGFFNYLRYGESLLFTDEKVLGKTQRPLHLLELYRSYFISLPTDPTKRSKNVRDEDAFYDYAKRSRAFGSAMELKSRWIFLKRAYEDDIAFHSHSYYGVVELPKRAVTPNTKAIYMNMLAYELCAHNPNDFRVSTYLRIMKSLIARHEDVKELKKKNILLHSLCRDEDVVKMYEEIDVPSINLCSFSQFWRVINSHLDNKYKTWTGELITDYLGSPWKTVALLATTAILFTSFLQTYFTAKQLPDH